ncbi:16S rRNA (cytosine(967)-C(5))-methyltransferase [Chroococcidiopsis sp. CCALA 051]|uniref:16S rRNA (cytosine(967)-C(5))-methyltransferase n=1 Tax=Chroococcidiopsis sp. CCALA 051 TaxID=869949 RepID=UPI000D0DA5DE|nr:16S rRNA (cytosine(967)-C(5))-methyltransferase [Chroococcidiopsis sp. CCALA 051]PSM49461.1 16S rRNA (cytosine(967)-C(5))-methyltransferase [Chroococcidiopsis sp. CCALA 051]
MENPRQLAFIALKAVHRDAYADVALDRVLSQSNLNPNDRRLVTELVYGSVRRMRSLDALIDRLAKKKSHQQPPDLRTILHLGLYQLCYLTQIPSSAAVNTTVELAKTNGFAGLKGFVNGILRQFLRESGVGDKIQNSKFKIQNGDKGDKEDLGDKGEKQPTTNYPLPITHYPLPEDPVERLGILHSYPNWIIELWLEQLGLVETEQLCEWFNQPPAIDLRVNTLQTSIEEVETQLQAAGVSVTRLPHLPQALRLTGSIGAIQNLPGYSAGWWTVQDSSAQLVSHVLDPQAGEVVIDACAAPGGKTTHIAELMQDRGTIWACDRTTSRLNKLKTNAERLQLRSIKICPGDSRSLTQFTNIADRVLLDAPCSGLGTLHRHADARWRQTPASVQELANLQKELLDRTATWVKPGGILVYATCTLHPLENERVVEWFLSSHSQWQIDPLPPNSPATPFSTTAGWLKVFPHQHQMDGFFMVRLKRREQ